MRKRMQMLLLALVAGLGGFSIHVALAEGPPTNNPLVFRGTLVDNGQPVTGPRNILVALHDHATADSLRCVSDATPVTVNQGRFEVTLPCTTAVETYPDLWAEVTVGTAVLPRTKVTAVPFALEAKSALNARAATGALRGELDTLQPRAQTPRMTDWANYTPLLTTIDTGDMGTGVYSASGSWRREGDSMRVRIYTVFTNAPDKTGTFLWSLPGSYEVRQGPVLGVVGNGVVGRTTQLSEFTYVGVHSLYWHFVSMRIPGGEATHAAPVATTIGTYYELEALVPIEGWTTTTGN